MNNKYIKYNKFRTIESGIIYITIHNFTLHNPTRLYISKKKMYVSNFCEYILNNVVSTFTV